MTFNNKKLIVAGLLLFGQVIYFSDYIAPFRWGHIKVSGLACTCPDESVISGRLYLKAITPDSLRHYDLNYSEIYVTERPFTQLDPMGSDLYILEGQVIGKDRVSENDPWHPRFRVDKWRSVDVLRDFLVKVAFLMHVIGWLIAFRQEIKAKFS